MTWSNVNNYFWNKEWVDAWCTITQEEMNEWKPGDTLLLNGTIYTGRDAAHKRMVDMLNNGEELPTGTYYYMFERNTGETRTGWIYINRED